jgi:hypothetical protein
MRVAGGVAAEKKLRWERAWRRAAPNRRRRRAVLGVLKKKKKREKKCPEAIDRSLYELVTAHSRAGRQHTLLQY